MTEEKEEVNADNKNSTPPEKLLVDRPSDFQFHAAYLAYADAFDKSNSAETKKQLNQNLIALQQNQIDYTIFYRNIQQYRVLGAAQRGYGRAFMKTQKKSEWRRQLQRQERNKRHRK